MIQRLMTNSTSYFSFLNSIPPPIKSFLKRALVLFVVWKLLYHLLLYPSEFPNKQLTTLTAYSTGVLYHVFIKEETVDFKEAVTKGTKVTVVYVKSKRVLAIADGCNGLELYILYVGFLLCIPTTTKRLAIFAMAGVFGIYVLNTFRCLGLVVLFLHNYSFADFAHHYLFKMIIYAIIFYTWVKYSKKYFSYG